MNNQRYHEQFKVEGVKQYTVRRLREGRWIVLRQMRLGKYFCMVVDVSVDGSNLEQELIERGLTKP